MADPAADPIQRGPHGPHRPLRGPAFPIISRNAATDARGALPCRRLRGLPRPHGEPVPLAWRCMLGLLPDVERRASHPEREMAIEQSVPVTPASDALPSCVMGSSTRAERQRLAVPAPPMSPSAVSTASASAVLHFRGSIAHPTRSLCTLRHGRRHPQRNTRYQAVATLYLDGTFTRWITTAFMTH